MIDWRERSRGCLLIQSEEGDFSINSSKSSQLIYTYTHLNPKQDQPLPRSLPPCLLAL